MKTKDKIRTVITAWWYEEDIEWLSLATCRFFEGTGVKGESVGCQKEANIIIYTPIGMTKYYCREHAYADTLLGAIKDDVEMGIGYHWFKIIGRDGCVKCQVDLEAGTFKSPCLKYIY